MAVTLIGVVLLLVLAAQAGILRPEIRVRAGAVLAGALVGVAARLNARPGGRVGAIALAATGIAAAYMDVIAVTTIYEWMSAPVGLVIAAVIGGGNGAWLAGSCGIGAALAIVGALILLPSTANKIVMALLTAAGVLPAVRIGSPRADGRRFDGRRPGGGAARDRARR